MCILPSVINYTRLILLKYFDTAYADKNRCFGSNYLREKFARGFRARGYNIISNVEDASIKVLFVRERERGREAVYDLRRLKLDEEA